MNRAPLEGSVLPPIVPRLIELILAEKFQMGDFLLRSALP